MKRKNLWITLALFNLCFVALFGLVLRTKFLFHIPIIDYRHVLSAHSHFAFGGWVTMILMLLMIENLLNDELKKKNQYQVVLWGIMITAWGMLLSFPFGGYTIVSIIFSTFFIFFTYAFSWIFIKDLRKSNPGNPISLLAISALICLVLSSAGPFSLAYMMATGKGNALVLRDAVYTFLHFQYNGFFTLSVLALYFKSLSPVLSVTERKLVSWFAIFLVLSILPSLFLTMLWHGYHRIDSALAFIGCILITISVLFFVLILIRVKKRLLFSNPLANSFLIFSLGAFVIKMILQMGTIIPALGKAVFGFRPIIIGFLHLVFLVMVTFYVLAFLIHARQLNSTIKAVRFSLLYFFFAALFNEAILLVDGIGLMFYKTYPIYPWLLWVAGILLFTGAVLLFFARIKSIRAMNLKIDNE